MLSQLHKITSSQFTILVFSRTRTYAYLQTLVSDKVLFIYLRTYIKASGSALASNGSY